MGKPMLAALIERLREARAIDELIVATTDQPTDDPIAALATEQGVACFRGSEMDVLDRFYRAASAHNADVIVRLTADNPLVDGELVSEAVDALLHATPALDYVCSLASGGFPLGLSVEVFTMPALTRAWREDRNAAWREHVTAFINQHPETFHRRELTHQPDLSHLRLTVDTPQDLELIRRIFGAFGHIRFSWRDVPPLLAQHPDWLALNSDVEQRTVEPTVP